jgi:hypothetical protein
VQLLLDESFKSRSKNGTAVARFCSGYLNILFTRHSDFEPENPGRSAQRDRQEEIVRRSWHSPVKPLAGVLALVLAVTFTAPTFAAEPAQPAGQANARPLAAAVAATLSSMPVPAAAITQEPVVETGGGGKSFFKSNKGIADRVHSPIR